MQTYIKLSQTEILLSFAASCIEGVARRLGIGYQEAYARLKRANLIDKYIIEFYDVLHQESRAHVIDDVVECLNTWEHTK